MIYMMKPNDEQSHKKTKTKRNGKAGAKRSNNRLPWKLILSFSLVALLMLTAWIQERSIAGKGSDNGALHDFSLVYNWSDKLLSHGAMNAEWSYRWDVILTHETMETLAGELFLSQRGEQLAKNVRQGGEVIDGNWKLSQSTLRLVRTDMDKIAQKVTVTLQVDASYLDRASELKKAVEELHTMLQAKDQNVQMNVKVFGQAKSEQGIEEVKQLSVAQTIEEYQDRGTNSATLFSNQVKQYRWLNNEKMANIQVALHSSSEDGSHSLTIGVPLISGEFGEAFSSPLEGNN